MTPADDRRPAGLAAGLLAAVLFGISAPVADRLGGDHDPQTVAGLLYAGAFVAIGPAAWRRRRRVAEAPLRRSDLAPLAGVVLLGGVVAPVLMLAGFRRATGVSGSLLLDLEGPLTAALGVLAFGEHLGRRGTLAAALTFGGGVVLTGAGGPLGTVSIGGALLIAGACACWAVDNNLTQRLTVRDPFAIVAVKAGASGALNLVSGAARGHGLPGSGAVGGLLVVGAAGYGLSVVADAYALRALGAAREATVFATAPFVGAVVAFVVLGERVGWPEGAAGALMIAGLVVLHGERHAHHHRHEALVHEHAHTHDDGHHDHAHAPGEAVPVGAAHSHPHHHLPVAHVHPHVSDAHHRHEHGR